ncbi:DUF2291 family protein [Pirellulales bacterium]|nr:DUF2291 family protein [Pirellulales bacterium]
MTRQRLISWSCGLIVLAALCHFFPLFRVTSLEVAEQQAGNGLQSPASVSDFADRFWNTQLREAHGQAVEVQSLLQAGKTDPSEARARLGRQVGLGGATFFFVRGAGRVEEIGPNRCLLFVEGTSDNVCIETGVIIGNSVRDGTGLIDVNQFASSQEFNEISFALNQRVEELVLEPAKEKLMRGALVRFVGCSEVGGDEDFDPLCVVPVYLEIHDDGIDP